MMSETEPTTPAPTAGENALGKVKGLIDEHPVAMLAGGILLGALVANALPRPRPVKIAPTGKPRSSFIRRAVKIAALGGELAAAYAAGAGSAVESAAASASEAAKPKARRLGDLASTALCTLGPVLKRLGSKTAD
jgi:hypothetical protein